jgi:hypothetical protein
MQKKGLLWILALILIIVPLIIVSSKSKSFKNLLTSKNEDEVVETTGKKQNHSSNIASVKQIISKQKQRIEDKKNIENNQ